MVILLFFVFLLVGARWVYALNTGLSIQPVKVSHTIEKGKQVSGKILLTNASDETINVDVTVEDFVPAANTTDIQFVGRAEGLTTVRDWITLNIPEQFIFKKNESKEITYTIKAPDNAEPGSHFGVAFFKATKIDDTGQLKVGTRVGMLIFITVPGNFLQKGEILDFNSPWFVPKGPVNFTVKFKNTGTVHYEPKGIITITNLFGKKVSDIPIEGQIVLPTGVRDLKAQWNTGNNLLLGRYGARVNIMDGEGNIITTRAIAFYAFPIWYVFISVLIAVLAFFVLRLLKNKIKISVSLKK